MKTNHRVGLFSGRRISAMEKKLKYQRVLLKLSGEALAGEVVLE